MVKSTSPRVRSGRFLAALGVLMVSAPPLAAASLPPAVERAIAENKATCSGHLTLSNGFVTTRDVNRDGVPDYVLDYAHWRCGDGPPDFCGSAGCLMQVFVSGPDGGYAKAFDENGTVAFLDLRGRPAMKVTLAGSACGKANAESCVEIRVWDGRRFTRSR